MAAAPTAPPGGPDVGMSASVRRWVAGLLLAAGLVGCTGRSTSDRDLLLVDPGGAQKLVGEHKVWFGLGGSGRGTWVDPRTESDFRAGHIPGAINLPFQDLAAERDRLSGYDVLVVYGDGYHDPKAEGMSKRLIELGFKDVRTLRGGLRAWTAAGNPLETGEALSTP